MFCRLTILQSDENEPKLVKLRATLLLPQMSHSWRGTRFQKLGISYGISYGWLPCFIKWVVLNVYCKSFQGVLSFVWSSPLKAIRGKLSFSNPTVSYYRQNFLGEGAFRVLQRAFGEKPEKLNLGFPRRTMSLRGSGHNFYAWSVFLWARLRLRRTHFLKETGYSCSCVHSAFLPYVLTHNSGCLQQASGLSIWTWRLSWFREVLPLKGMRELGCRLWPFPCPHVPLCTS